MVEQLAPPTGGGANPTPSLQQIQSIARQRFEKDPSKCYQRHIREVHGKAANRDKITTLSGASVEPITNVEASEIILKYEWLGSMGTGTQNSYGLKLNGEILGAVCFGAGTSDIARKICTPEDTAKTICLLRGACVPWAPKNAASFLISHACRLAHKLRGWEIFFAYSDPEAGEIGTVYQSCNWHYIGSGIGHGKQGHHDFYSPDGKVLTSSRIYGKSGDKRLTKLGWTEGISKRDWLRANGWEEKVTKNKGKWVWFEGRSKERLKNNCRFPFLSYPKMDNEKFKIIKRQRDFEKIDLFK